MKGEEKMKEIIAYLMEAYQPSVILPYGSYANGTNNQDSDFDALVVTERPGSGHDGSVVAGVQLDVFLYPPRHFQGDFDPEEIVQVFDGTPLLDRDGLGAQLLRRVREYLAQYQPKPRERTAQDVAWCGKMVRRCRRGDPEGFYRWHWLLRDSLEIYYDLWGKYFFGPKKALAAMEREDPASYRLYARALAGLDLEALEAWTSRLEELLEKGAPRESGDASPAGRQSR